MASPYTAVENAAARFGCTIDPATRGEDVWVIDAPRGKTFYDTHFICVAWDADEQTIGERMRTLWAVAKDAISRMEDMSDCDVIQCELCEEKAAA